MKIVTYPHKSLLQPSQKVSLPLQMEDVELIRNMYKTVKNKGVGLAAPQVAVSKQICIIKLDPDMADKKDKELEFVIINPEITFYSELKIALIEGCLSFPGLYYKIYRPQNIQLEYDTIINFQEFIHQNSDPKIKRKKLTAGGWLSRVIQHEVDHLQAKLFINLGGKKIEEESLDGRQIID